MQKPWSLYNKEDKLRVDDLTPEQVRIVLLATASSRMTHWYACQEGDVHWQPIGAIPEFYEDVRQIKGQPADEDDRHKEIGDEPEKHSLTQTTTKPPVTPPVQRRPLFEDAPEDKTEPTLQVDVQSTKERRTARRYPRKLTFKVNANGQVFQCETVDISMTGFSLEQDLPEWVQKNFNAELSMNKHAVRVACSRVSGKKIKIKESSSWDVIRAWIVNW